LHRRDQIAPFSIISLDGCAALRLLFLLNFNEDKAMTTTARDSMEFDIVIVGAGPAGLSAAIRLKQLTPELNVCVLEKGAEVGAHILSGAVLEPRALNELIPDWRARGAPLNTPATDDHFLLLSAKKAWRCPTPAPMRNHGNYIISLGNFCRWLAQQAESLGVEIYPGFAASEILYDADSAVCGVATGDMGIGKDGQPTARFQRGMELRAKHTLFAEGCRGSLTKIIIERFNLAENSNPQTYGIGIKELWEIDPAQHCGGKIIHSVGWPLDSKTYGGSFLYHLENNQVAVGFVVGLDYENPYLNPFAEFQRFKTHPAIRAIFADAKRIGYGARALNEGGLQSLPKLTFPGGSLIGDCAGFLNVPKIKGTHTAMKSGMVAAESICAAWCAGEINNELVAYSNNLRASWVWEELRAVRNIRPAFRYGLWAGLAYAALDTYLLRGRAPWTFKNHADHLQLKKARASKKIIYPKSDNVITFDKLSSVYLSNTQHEENQPVHLQLNQPQLAIEVNLAEYAAPEQRYCPAGVYEIVRDAADRPRLQINAQNCVHCKTCDIKDPLQNINWVPPEGGGGPGYSGM
jgi:electron-transferring-flavoprotein dehydrogenase